MIRKCAGASLLVSLLFGCAGENGEENPLDQGPGQFDPDFETSDEFFTRMSMAEVGLATASPHGKVRIWYSKNLEPAVDMEQFTAPEGSVAIKAQQYEEDEYTELLVMIKGATGSSPASDDWTFEVRTAEGRLVGPSDPSFCSDCHNQFPDQGNLPGIVLSN